jgi:ABC-type molybdate transport system permease subunit
MVLRLALIEIALFLAPFAIYAAWLWFTRGSAARSNWTAGPVYVLALAGLILTVIGFVLLASFGEAERGTYRPAEVRDGVLVPGRFE